jgi:hypothetical protein
MRQAGLSSILQRHLVTLYLVHAVATLKLNWNWKCMLSQEAQSDATSKLQDAVCGNLASFSIPETGYKQDRQCAYRCNIEVCSPYHCYHRKVINIIHSECVSVAFVTSMQGAHAILIYCHLWPVCLFHIFPHLINSMIFRGKMFLNIKCVQIFSTTSVWNISHSKKNSDRYYSAFGKSLCTYATVRNLVVSIEVAIIHCLMS